uniref:Uncharacterized protein n=1 Tax=Anopheles merus TaxID=30066 RepID=A0A182UZA2_ANOME
MVSESVIGEWRSPNAQELGFCIENDLIHVRWQLLGDSRVDVAEVRKVIVIGQHIINGTDEWPAWQQHFVLQESFLCLQCGADCFLGRAKEEPMLAACHYTCTVLCFIKGFAHTECVIAKQSAMNHQFELTVYQTGAALGTIVQHCHT